MDKRNIDGFNQEHPGQGFPPFRSLDDGEMGSIRQRLGRLLGLPSDADGLALVKQLAGIAAPCVGYDADSNDFNLAVCLGELEVNCHDKLLINFHRFDDIDEMNTDDVSRHFRYIWYPNSDDIDLFDESLAWVVSVSHDGELSLARF